ncbi:SH3 domain-containing protein, partial [Eubacteriales bacterium OttesenSCG-928-K08]|nr:SH3 domain-containing protein [Eubacteriales bacterium OttesenSCG-928-K08]
KKIIRLVTIILTLTLVLTCFAPIALAASSIGTGTTTGSVNLRTGPSTTYNSLGKVSKGKTVEILEAPENGWVKVEYNGKTGYISEEVLNHDLNSGIVAGLAGVTTATAKLRKTASNSGSLITSIPKTTDVIVLNSSDDKWWEISYTRSGKEYTGFVSTTQVKLGTAADEKAAASTTKASTSTSTKKATTADVNASKIAAAKKKNSDTVGWLNIPNTNIDDPILYGSNFYYATHDISKSKSYKGVYPYVNYVTKNIVIFTHNLRSSATGGHHLHHLQESALGYSRCQHSGCKRSFSSGLSDWYKSSSGRTWNISIFGMQKWEVFSMYEVPKNEPSSTLNNAWNLNPSSMQSWIDGQLKRSEINFGVKVSASDQIMTIVTCGTNYDSATANSRLFVFLKNVDS